MHLNKLTIYRDEGCAICEKLNKKMYQCSNCQSKPYCSTECQKKDWPTHKIECSKIIGARKKIATSFAAGMFGIKEFIKFLQAISFKKEKDKSITCVVRKIEGDNPSGTLGYSINVTCVPTKYVNAGCDKEESDIYIGLWYVDDYNIPYYNRQIFYTADGSKNVISELYEKYLSFMAIDEITFPFQLLLDKGGLFVMVNNLKIKVRHTTENLPEAA